MPHTEKHFNTINPHILIAVDGSENSDIATRTGIELAKALKATVILVCVIDLSNLVSSVSVSGVIDNEIMQVYHEEAEKINDTLAKKYPYDKLKKLTPEGLPAEAIIHTSAEQKADMIIMGTHGRTGIRHLLIGSVAENVIRHSHVPVLVVPMPK